MGLIRRVLFGSSFGYWLGFEGGKFEEEKKIQFHFNNVFVCFLFVWCIVYVLALPPHQAF